MTITTKLRYGLFQGADTQLIFTVEPTVLDPPPLDWEVQFVMRRASSACPGREDPGDGAVVLVKTDGEIARDGNDIIVSLLRADTIDLQADDYYAALWRTDDGNDRPLCILRYLHLSAAPRQAS